MAFWLRLGGVLLGAISLFSLAQKLYGYGLAAVFKDVVNFYRAAFHPIAEAVAAIIKWLFSIVHVHLPTLPPDAIVLHFLFASALFRVSIDQYKERIGTNRYFAQLLGGIALKTHKPQEAAMYIGLLSVFWPITAIIALIQSPFRSEHVLLRGSGVSMNLPGWLFEIAKVVAAFLILFGTNAYFS